MDLEITNKAPENWDKFLLDNPSGTIYQSTFYAEYAEKEVGFIPLYCRAIENGETKAQLLFFQSTKYYGLKNKFPYSIVFPLIKKVFPQIHWTYGPVGSSEAINYTIKEMLLLSQKKKMPIVDATLFPLDQSIAMAGAGALTKKATFVVDLSLPEETLWQNIDHSARKLVKRTEADGVIIRSVETEEDLRKYFEVINESRQRNKLISIPYSPLLWEIWSKNNIGKILLAEKDAKVLAGLGISFFNGYLNEWGAGTSAEALEKKIYAGDLIKWHIIKWGKTQGHKYYDLSGVVPDSPDPKEQGIFRYKQKWGGKLVEFSAITHNA